MKHLLHWKDWDSEVVHQILDEAITIKKSPEQYTSSLQGQNILLFFEKTSTRTRISFAVGANQLGANVTIVDPGQSQVQKTKLSYEIRAMSGYCDLIVARLKNHQDLLAASQMSRAPMVNGCCNLYHPCQALADVLTMQEHQADFKNIKLVFVGVYNNVVNSLVAMSNHFGFQLCLVCPIALLENVDKEQQEKALRQGLLTQTTDLSAALKNADFVYTDTWIDMEFFLEKKHLLAERKRIMMPYQLNLETLQGFTGKIMHDMPIHEGYEMVDKLVNAENSIIFQQSDNRLHAQKAILLYLNKHTKK